MRVEGHCPWYGRLRGYRAVYAGRLGRRGWDLILVAALVGLDRGELVTIPPLQNEDEWSNWEAARRALSQRFSHSVPAARYQIGVAAQQAA